MVIKYIKNVYDNIEKSREETLSKMTGQTRKDMKKLGIPSTKRDEYIQILFTPLLPPTTFANFMGIMKDLRGKNTLKGKISPSDVIKELDNAFLPKNNLPFDFSNIPHGMGYIHSIF